MRVIDLFPATERYKYVLNFFSTSKGIKQFIFLEWVTSHVHRTIESKRSYRPRGNCSYREEVFTMV